MSIITISRGSYSRGKVVAEKVAEQLGYECVSREVFLEATGQFNTPEIKMVRAIHDAPSILERFTYGKERYIAFFRAAFLKHMQNDNVVYHGLAGHFFLQDIPHVMKVRVIADLEMRVKEEMRREGISADEARHVIVKDDSERRRWSLHLHGIDTWTPELYDAVYHIHNMTVDDVVESVVHTVQRPCFQTSPKSQRLLDDLVLSAQVEATLISEFPRVEATTSDGKVTVVVRVPIADEQRCVARVEEVVSAMDDVESVRVNVVPTVIRD